jgi:hypothetical protein
MKEELTLHEPEPAPPGRAFMRQAAQFAVAAPLITWSLSALVPNPRSDVTKIVVGAAGTLIVVVGFVLAIVALRSVRRYGREGIRGLALAGVIINGVILIVAMVGLIVLIPALKGVARVQNAGYTKAEMEAMPEVIPGSRKIFDETVGFRIEIPEGFEDGPRAPQAETPYSFVRPDAERGNLVVTISRLGFRIWGPMRPEEFEAAQRAFPTDAVFRRSTRSWGHVELEVVTAQWQAEGKMVCVHFTCVPLCREAIQLTVTSLSSRESESMCLLYQLLTGLKGMTYADSVARVKRGQDN